MSPRGPYRHHTPQFSWIKSQRRYVRTTNTKHDSPISLSLNQDAISLGQLGVSGRILLHPGYVGLLLHGIEVVVHGHRPGTRRPWFACSHLLRLERVRSPGPRPTLEMAPTKRSRRSGTRIRTVLATASPRLPATGRSPGFETPRGWGAWTQALGREDLALGQGCRQSVRTSRDSVRPCSAARRPMARKTGVQGLSVARTPVRADGQTGSRTAPPLPPGRLSARRAIVFRSGRRWGSPRPVRQVPRGP